jgi:hypothetical protein
VLVSLLILAAAPLQRHGGRVSVWHFCGRPVRQSAFRSECSCSASASTGGRTPAECGGPVIGCAESNTHGMSGMMHA